MRIFDGLLGQVGDLDALLNLNADPLPDEPFDWSGVEERDAPMVRAILDRSDACCTEILDLEFRTIARRILARVAARDPKALRRSTNHDRVAAGLVWLVGRANGEFGRRGRWTSGRLWKWFGVTSCSDRGWTLGNAADLIPEVTDSPWQDDQVELGDARLLHSRIRSQLITRRDSLHRYDEQHRPWSVRDDGHSTEVRARRVKALVAAKGLEGDTPRALVMIGLGDDIEDASFFGLSIPDARHLVTMVQRALDSSLPSPTGSDTDA